MEAVEEDVTDNDMCTDLSQMVQEVLITGSFSELLRRGSPSRWRCWFQGCDHRERGDSDVSFESAALVHCHRS